ALDVLSAGDLGETAESRNRATGVQQQVRNISAWVVEVVLEQVHTFVKLLRALPRRGNQACDHFPFSHARSLPVWPMSALLRFRGSMDCTLRLRTGTFLMRLDNPVLPSPAVIDMALVSLYTRSQRCLCLTMLLCYPPCTNAWYLPPASCVWRSRWPYPRYYSV